MSESRVEHYFVRHRNSNKFILGRREEKGEILGNDLRQIYIVILCVYEYVTWIPLLYTNTVHQKCGKNKLNFVFWASK